MYIYQRLKDLREDLDLKQKDIAKIINTTANYYGDYEKGKRDIPTSRMVLLADYYKVSMDYITSRTNDKGGLHKNSKEEQEILKLYNQLTEKNKGKAEILLSQLLKKQDSKETESGQEQKVKKYENNISISQRDNGKVNIKNK